MIIRGVVAKLPNGDSSSIHVQARQMTYIISAPSKMRNKEALLRPGSSVIIDLGNANAAANQPNDALSVNITENDKFDCQMDAFATVESLTTQTYSDICAVVLSTKPLLYTKGTDCLFTLEIADETGKISVLVFLSGPENLEKFAPVEVAFDPSLDYKLASNFKLLFQAGDVLLIRNVKRSSNGNSALVHKSCQIRLLANVAKYTKNHSSLTCNEQESIFVRYFADFYFSSNGSKESLLSHKKEKTISEIKKNTYINIIGKILSIDCETSGNVCITDYTSNPTVAPTKRGKFELNMLLYINVYGRHVKMLKSLKVGDICLFENVKVKEYTTSLSSYMSESKEGNITLISNPEILAEFGKREAEYFNKEITGSDDGLLVSERRQPAVSIDADLENSLLEKGVVPYTRIRDIRAPGIYFLDCHIKSFEVLDTDAGPYLKLVIKDRDTSMTVVARHKLTKRLVGSNLLGAGMAFKCMVLCMAPVKNRNFIVTTFYEDNEVVYLLKKYAG